MAVDLCFPQFERTSKVRLGDAIVLASLFAHYGDVRWHTFGHEEPNSLWSRIAPMFNHKFNLEMVYGSTMQPGDKYPIELVIEQEVGIIKPRLIKKFKHRGQFVTAQVGARNVNRSVDSSYISKHTGGLPVMELSGNQDPLNVLFGKVAAAKHHIGVDSGCTWVAISVGTPVKLMLTGDDKFANPLHRDLARAHQEVMRKHNVTVVEEGL